MTFLELAEERYSVRTYQPDPIPGDLLDQVLEAARLAPTAANEQPFQLIVMQTKGRKEELRRIYDREWFVQGPLVIGIVAIPEQAWVRSDGVNYAWVDATIVMDHLILAATDAGLGTCWIGAFNPAAACEVLGLPDGVEPVAFTPLGFPAEEPGFKRRKRLNEIVRYDRW
jgi:nitroreductase